MTSISTQERILQVASKLFMSQGYGATSTRMIADEADITQPNLYYHFSGKEELFVASYRHVSKQAAEHLRAIVQSDDNLGPEEHLQRAVSFRRKLVAMSLYLTDELPINIPILMKDIRQNMSDVTSTELQDVWTQSYLKPFIDLFDEYTSIMTRDIAQSYLMTFYLTFLSSYMQLHNLQEQTLTVEQGVDIFIKSCVDPKIGILTNVDQQ